jgi:hypothetical protein
MGAPDSLALSQQQPTHITLPDLPAYSPFKVRLNQYMDSAGRESEDWVIEGGNLGSKHAAKLRGVKARQLTAGCYPDADIDEFRVCCDVMNWLVGLNATIANIKFLTSITSRSFIMIISRMTWISPERAVQAKSF